ncbi:MAG: 3'-5' exonuclease [Sandaracinaceae bacterium]
MTSFAHFVLLDFEATCDEGAPPRPQEIIEFPSVLMSARTFEIEDEFESFVRPVHHPTLTDFCRELTGIEQSYVDRAETFPAVLERHLAWLRDRGLTSGGGREERFAFVTCGDWDLGTMLPRQLQVCEPPPSTVPAPYRRWINIKRPFRAWRGTKRRTTSMVGMLEELDLELTGRHHRGIDDCRNLAKVLRRLLEEGVELSVTATVSRSQYPPLNLRLRRGPRVQDVVLRRRAVASLRGLASAAFRTHVTGLSVASGEAITDDDALFELEPGATIHVH